MALITTYCVYCTLILTDVTMLASICVAECPFPSGLNTFGNCNLSHIAQKIMHAACDQVRFEFTLDIAVQVKGPVWTGSLNQN